MSVLRCYFVGLGLIYGCAYEPIVLPVPTVDSGVEAGYKDAGKDGFDPAADPWPVSTGNAGYPCPPYCNTPQGPTDLPQ